MPDTQERLLTLQETADYLGVPLATLYAWRSRGQAPRGFKVGRHVRVKASDVESWLAERVDDPAPAA